MPWLREFGDVLARAAHLLALTLAPWGLSPEPAPYLNLPLADTLSAIALGIVLFAASRLRAAVPSRLGRAAGALIWLAVAASLVASAVFHGARAPLGRGVLWIAPVVWGAVALAAAAAAERWLA